MYVVSTCRLITLVNMALQWRHNERDGVSNLQPRDCLFNRLFRRRSKQTSKLHVTGLCEGNSPVTGEFPHKGPVTRKMLKFDDVIMRKITNYLSGFAGNVISSVAKSLGLSSLCSLFIDWLTFFRFNRIGQTNFIYVTGLIDNVNRWTLNFLH